MKIIYTKLLFIFICASFAIQPMVAQTSGGPDDYGYTWKNSDDPEGPTYEWIDISESGTEITGLADDNSAPLVDMGFDFQYYWLEFDRVKIGSNGWLSFSNVANVAHCFPRIPTAGGGNNLVCPLMTDLNFDGSGNPGRVVYQNLGDGRFVVSYLDVPFWIASTPPAPSFTGSNTFQVVFDSNDNSITFNYMAVEDGVYDPNAACTEDAVIGMENTTGTIGLEIAVQLIPNDETSIRFEYPDPVTFSITDITADWNIESHNAGVFYLPEDDIPLSIGLTNSGNVDIEDAVSVLARISASGVNYQQTASTSGTIAPNETVVLDLPLLTPTGTDNVAGNYTMDILAGTNGDLVNSNNTNISEFSVLDISNPDGITFSYVTGDAASAQASWTNGGGNSGMAVFIEPPFYPAVITAIEVFALGDDSGGLDDSYTVQIYDDNGAGGAPGTLRSIEIVEGGSYNPAGEWVTTTLQSPVTVNSGGFYAAWVMQGNTLAIGTEATAPISRRSFELIANAFAQYRSNEAADLMIRAIVQNDFIVDVDDVELTNNVKVFPNPTTGTLQIENNLSEETIQKVQLLNPLGQIVEDIQLNLIAGNGHTMDIGHLPFGVYYLNIQTNSAQTTRKVMLTR